MQKIVFAFRAVIELNQTKRFICSYGFLFDGIRRFQMRTIHFVNRRREVRTTRRYGDHDPTDNSKLGVCDLVVRVVSTMVTTGSLNCSRYPSHGRLLQLIQHNGHNSACASLLRRLRLSKAKPFRNLTHWLPVK